MNKSEQLSAGSTKSKKAGRTRNTSSKKIEAGLVEGDCVRMDGTSSAHILELVQAIEEAFAQVSGPTDDRGEQLKICARKLLGEGADALWEKAKGFLT